jgi:hypothetical protein
VEAGISMNLAENHVTFHAHKYVIGAFSLFSQRFIFRPLGCGNHKCVKVCHKGPCEECPMLPKNVTTCPCGKIPLDLLSPKLRTSCLDEVKTCPNVCGKTLLCGKHPCPNKCHSGPCPRCQETVKAPCRCHGTFVAVPCYQVNGTEKSLDKLICNKLCKAKRVCGRHDCGNQCCPSSPIADPDGYDFSGSHICNLICNRKLKCNKHLCDLLCHSGRCPPCHIVRENSEKIPDLCRLCMSSTCVSVELLLWILRFYAGLSSQSVPIYALDPDHADTKIPTPATPGNPPVLLVQLLQRNYALEITK